MKGEDLQDHDGERSEIAEIHSIVILGDPGAESGGKGKSKGAEKYGTKKSKERREEPLGTMSYHTSSKRSPPFWILIGTNQNSERPPNRRFDLWGHVLMVTAVISTGPQISAAASRL